MRWRASITIVSLALLTGCSSAGGPAGPGGKGPRGAAGRPSGPVEVTVASAAGTAWVPRVELGATLAPWDTVTISAQVAGALSRLEADLGDRVKKGQRLGEISPEELGWAAEKAEADASLAEATLKRLEALVQNQSATPEELDRAKADAARARAEANLARKKVADATLRAPFDAWVSQRFLARGDYVQVGKAILTLTAADPLRLRAAVPERYAGDIRAGTKVELTLPGVATPSSHSVSRVSPLIDPASRTFIAEADVPNPDGSIKAGTFATAAFVLGEARPVATVPEAALTVVAGTSEVFVIDGDTAHARPVTVLSRSEARLQLDGIDVGVQVAVTGVNRLYEGAKVSTSSKGEAAR